MFVNCGKMMRIQRGSRKKREQKGVLECASFFYKSVISGPEGLLANVVMGQV